MVKAWEIAICSWGVFAAENSAAEWDYGNMERKIASTVRRWMAKPAYEKPDRPTFRCDTSKTSSSRRSLEWLLTLGWGCYATICAWGHFLNNTEQSSPRLFQGKPFMPQKTLLAVVEFVIEICPCQILRSNPWRWAGNRRSRNVR